MSEQVFFLSECVVTYVGSVLFSVGTRWNELVFIFMYSGTEQSK
ncbi:Uncharacterised protein [Salmonella enterica subsp. enterica serovar Sendai]|nr:Uncharacterised protein [Salmonella enterica subsp. enterica serovar Sendai]